MTDSDFIEKLKQQDSLSYTRLFDTYFRQLHRFAVSFIGDHDSANDIVQLVFISLYENAARLSPEIKLSSWLFTSVRNRCLNFLRDREVEIRNKLIYLQNYEETDNMEYFDDTELFAKIRFIVDGMPKKCREICELRFYQNMQQNEIAEKLSLSINTVKVQIHRAIKKIRQSVEPEDLWLIPFLIYICLICY
ncbi:DNA-directed RNA polymerase sigma-70 factor [Bacteroidia bacterium]|nr:DNA-directed RNA polymerase sigma-70 factor [Bacteroidia bacterium]GHT62145.1 DNA-directed RNA polymerase sigma-70 factor [Bacteroidia bacterium]